MTQAKKLSQPMIHFELQLNGINYSFIESDSNYCPFNLYEQIVGEDDPDVALHDMFGFESYEEGRAFFIERIGAENAALLDAMPKPCTRFVIPVVHDYIERMGTSADKAEAVKLCLTHAVSQQGAGLLSLDDLAYLVETAGKFLKKLTTKFA